jgi:hypothetical protein
MSRLIDDTSLATLLGSLGHDQAAVARFVRDFVSLWDTRVQRLTDALELPDPEEIHVVLLSIRSSSQMIGAHMLEATAGLMHSALARQDIDGARQHLGRLIQVGQETSQELSERFAIGSTLV